MSGLFEIQPELPEGFSYFPDFISREQETELCKYISQLELKTFLFRGYEAKRRVASFGYDYHFDNKNITKGLPIPQQFHYLVFAVAKFLEVPVSDFAELLVTEYPPGSVINWHRDAQPFELIAGISLFSDCKFKLRPYDKEKQGRKSIITLPVDRCSLYAMKGAARDEWEHSIAEMKQTRYLITLRTLRKKY